MHNTKELLIKLNIILCLFLILSCNNKKDNKPEDILSEDVMVKILTEAYIIEASIPELETEDKDIRIYVPKIYQQTFNKYNTTKDEFDKSYHYYNNDFKKMDSIIEKVIIELNKIDRSLQVD